MTPEEIDIEKHLMRLQGGGAVTNPYWPTWVSLAWDNPRTYRLVERYMHRPAEELYHTAQDPYELTDLADDPQHAARKSRLGSELDHWMKSQGDPGAAQDTHEALQAARRGDHLYVPGD